MLRPAPLTEEEEALQSVRRAELEASQGTAARKSHVSSGVSFPFSSEAVEALKNLTSSNGFISLVQLVLAGPLKASFPDANSSQAVNTERETIELANATSSNVGDFTRVIPNDAPRYSFFLFKRS